MSLTDPDARNRRIGSFLQPFAWVLALLALASSPVMVAILDSSEDPSDGVIVVFLLYVLFTVGFGLMLYYTAAHRNGLGVTSYCIAYAGGLFLILGAAPDKVSHLPEGIIPADVLYGVALVLLIIYITHAVVAHQTLQDGVTTTAVVTSAGINGMVNYVQHWHLTLKFTDKDGKDRWFHIGRTGLGYSVGQEFQIKYNPNHPGSKRGIVVLNG
jgi:hypothetical protein